MLTETTFAATGLPGGEVSGLARHSVWPAGFQLKHAHGGNAYVYLIAGTLEITEPDGTVTAYHAGDFFWEPGGHTHTARTPEGAEFFILFFLAPGAEPTIPVP